MRTCTDYRNIAWGRNNRANLKNIKNQQKHPMLIKYYKYRFTYMRELFGESKILNVVPLNILNSLVFMHKIKSQTAPKYFKTSFVRQPISI